MIRPGRMPLFLVFTLLAACQDGGRGPKSADSSDTSVEGPSDDDASVYDEDGAAHHCRLESSDCRDIQLATDDFDEQCQIAGFHIVRCGCKDYCSGNPRSSDLHYDSKNQGALCEPPRECEPTQTSAAFQDACAESGGRFVQCGCVWRCSRKLKQPVADRPKPVEEPADAGAPGDKKGKKGKKKITTLDG